MEELQWLDYGMLLDLIALYKVHSGMAELAETQNDEDAIPDIE